MSLSLREVALEAGEPIEPGEVVEVLQALQVSRYQQAWHQQIVGGRARGLVALTLVGLGWAVDELSILDEDELLSSLLPDSAALSDDAMEVLLTLELAEDQGNMVGQCIDKAVKCHQLLLAGMR